MKAPPNDIDPPALASAVRCQQPAVGIQSSLEFLPLGEDSYVYANPELFVRLQRDRPGLGLEAAMHSIERLPLRFVLKPLTTFRFGPYVVAAFPFIGGRILGNRELRDAGRCLAELHSIHDEDLPRERFELPFGPTLERVMVSGLLTPEEASKVGSVAVKIATLGETLRGEPTDFVVTHGDPNTHNWLVEPGGRLWLCDWGDIGIGPRERDLFAFSALEHSLAFEGYGRRPDRRILEFYRLRWVLQEVADYGSRLLDPECPAPERQHARAELARYLL